MFAEWDEDKAANNLLKHRVRLKKRPPYLRITLR